MIGLVPLLADGWAEAIGAIVILVVTGLSALGQFMARQREKAAGAPRPADRPMGPAAGPQPVQPARPAPPVQPRRGALEDEIGEFLRRAAQQRGGQPQQADVAQPRRVVAQQSRPQPPRTLRPSAQPVEAEIVRGPVGEGVAQKVAKDLDTTEFKRRTAQLGQETRQAAARVEERLQHKFDHQLGQLAAKPQKRRKPAAPQAAAAAAADALPPTSAAGFAAILSDVDNVRQAIVLNEILQRPEHRW
ncbi:MAG: hypothetical protein JW809_09120 [Pirellulales bacterium]|nr:hypothetical protein [Pirellulales bacterium]